MFGGAVAATRRIFARRRGGHCVQVGASSRGQRPLQRAYQPGQAARSASCTGSELGPVQRQVQRDAGEAAAPVCDAAAYAGRELTSYQPLRLITSQLA